MNLTVIITTAIICITVIICFRISLWYDCQLAELNKKYEALKHTILHLEQIAKDLDVEKNSQEAFKALRNQVRSIWINL